MTSTPPGYTCAVCGQTTRHPAAVADRYCPTCHAIDAIETAPLFDMAELPGRNPRRRLREF